MGSRDQFAQKVLRVVTRVPPGRVTTYGTVASLAGYEGAARAVGTVLREARRPGVPYHRVVAAGGQLGGYSDPVLKRQLLAAEGVRFSGRRILDFAQVLWP